MTAAVAVLKASRDQAREAASAATERADKLSAELAEALGRNIDLRREKKASPRPMDAPAPDEAGVETGSK